MCVQGEYVVKALYYLDTYIIPPTWIENIHYEHYCLFYVYIGEQKTVLIFIFVLNTSFFSYM